LTSLVLAAESTEHRRAEEHVRHLADSDPLTGLANYRRLVDALDSEIKRYNRSQIPFAILLLDMDQLKKINDTHGHLVGSRALCRLADVLRLNCREIDIAARYGGDEFVLVLPEASANAALHVAQRISERLRNDGQEPPLSVSIGVANYPVDGATLEELLSAPDPAPYADKHTTKVEPYSRNRATKGSGSGPCRYISPLRRASFNASMAAPRAPAVSPFGMTWIGMPACSSR